MNQLPLSAFYFLFSRRRGQTLLSLVFLIGGIIIVVGLTLAVTVMSFLNSTYGFQLAERAQATALSGVEDALLQLDRNKGFSSPSGYPVTVGSYSAQVTVVQDQPLTGQVLITSSATISGRTRNIRAIAARSALTGIINLISWQQT